LLWITGLIVFGLSGTLLPGAARADVVVHDGGVNRDRPAREAVTARTGRRPDLILSSDVLAGPSRLLVANVSLERCEGRPVNFDVQRKLDQITDQVLAFDLEEARSSLAIVDTLLPCSSRPIDRRTLARFAFLRGATLLDLGEEDAATEAMKRAASFDPEYPGERGFPGPHIDLLKMQVKFIGGLRPGRLFVWAEPGTSALFVNGIETERVNNRGISIKPGTHLLQLVSSTGIQGMWVTTRGSSSSLVFPSSGRAVWADQGRSPGGERAMQLLLQDEFHGREGDVHTIHYQGRRGSGATYPRNGGARISWKKDDASKSRTSKKTRPRRGKSSSSSAKPKAQPETQEAPANSQSASASPQDSGLEEDPSANEAETFEATEAEPSPKKSEAAPEEAEPAPEKADSAPEQTDDDRGDETGPASEEAVSEEPEAPESATKPTTSPPKSRPGTPKHRKTPPPRAKTGKGDKNRLRFALSGGYQYADPFHYAMLKVDLSVRIIGILEVNAFVRPSYGGIHSFPVEDGASPIEGPVFFVPVGGSVGVRKSGDLSPWVALGGQVAWNRDGLAAAPYLFGALLHGGLDWSPAGSHFLVRAQGEIGNIGLHLNVSVSGGVGLRF